MHQSIAITAPHPRDTPRDLPVKLLCLVPPRCRVTTRDFIRGQIAVTAVRYLWYTRDYTCMYEFKYVHYEFDILNHKGFSNFTTLKFSCIFVTFKVLCEKKIQWKGPWHLRPFYPWLYQSFVPGVPWLYPWFYNPKVNFTAMSRGWGAVIAIDWCIIY